MSLTLPRDNLPVALHKIEQADVQNWKKTGDVVFAHSLTIDGGPNTVQFALGTTILDWVQVLLGGTFVSGGGAASVTGLGVTPGLTAAAGDAAVYGVNVVPTVTTQGASETVDVVASLRVYEPQVTVGSGDTVTAAASVYIENAPTEGTDNYALFVDDGPTRLDGDFILGVETGITASTTQSQGQQPLTKSINLVSTVANPNDVVTLPSAVAGRVIMIRDTAAQTLQIFPASGDAIDDGSVDASISLAATSGLILAATDSTNWYSFGTV